jgi:Core-2/I-Branching enzyme
VGSPRVAYLIASHKLPDQVLRLASVLRRGSPDASIVLHHDDRRCDIDRAAAKGLALHLVEPSSRADWGEISLLAMVLRCLRFCLDHVDFDWLVLLSGQDYPIRPIAEIEDALEAAEYDALLEARPCPRPGLRAPVDEFSGRYYFRWWRPRSASLAWLLQGTARRGVFVRTRPLPSGNWVAVRAVRNPFDRGLICHSGSDWFSLSRRAVEIVDAFVRERPKVLRYYRHTLHPTESFIQTVLANDASLRLSGDTGRFTVWGAPHETSPRVLRLDDVDAMLGSGCGFARKFDETVDLAVLDEIDRRVHSP